MKGEPAARVQIVTLFALVALAVTPGCSPSLSLEGSACDDAHPCPSGYRCTAAEAGKCYPTACDGTACADDEVCLQGECVETDCVEMSCEDGERCANKRCWPEDCPQEECADGEVCEEDTCVETRCVEGRCDCTTEEVPGESCADEADNDCDGFTDCEDSDCTHSTRSCGLCESGTSTCQEDKSWSTCEGETGCEPDATRPCGERDCGTQTCQSDCSWGDCVEGNPVEVCEQCGTGTCRDYLIFESHSGCGCADSAEAPNCNDTSYDVDCGGGEYCRYQRREVTEDCNCRWECS